MKSGIIKAHIAMLKNSTGVAASPRISNERTQNAVHGAVSLAMWARAERMKIRGMR